jgi:NADPH-dependent glutamate synthase beta subunit-like oxidoreductase
MQVAFYFDQTRCMGCYTCVVACKDWNDVPPGPASWRRVLLLEGGKFPNPFAARLSTSCYHCAEPACVYACPADAISKREEDGIVVVDREKCRGRDHCGHAVMVDFPVKDRKSPCKYACSAGVSVQGYNRLIAKGRFKEALALIRERMPLPAVCGRVCSSPCENVCKRQEAGEKPVSIKALKRFVSDNVTEEIPNALPITKDKKVAIVGSGPAGLAAAYDLIRKGYAVTVFEALPVAGGMLAVGMPEYRLPKDVLKKEIDYLKGLGIKIKTNTSIGKKLSLNDLTEQGYGAILLAIGAHRSPKLGIPGEDTKGVDNGISFLRKVSTGKKTKIGQKVAVIGGGNVAIDAARTALRLGAKEVQLNCLETREEMPALPEEIESALEEGITLSCSCGPKRILTENGKVTGVEFVRCTSVFDKEGRFCPCYDEDTVTSIEADTVILAVGQTPDTSALSEEIKTTRRGTIDVDPDSLATNLPGVFAGGDVVSGPARFVDAIAAGQKAAISIERYLEGADLKMGRVEEKVDAAQIKVKISDDLEKRERQTMPTMAVSKRIRNFKEVNLGFTEEMAIAEAQRCMICGGMLCREVCPYDTPQWGPEHDDKMQKCNLCVDRWEVGKPPICVASCLTRALDAGPIEEMEAKHGTRVHDAVGFAYTVRTQPSVVFKPKKVKGVPTRILVSPFPSEK